MKAFFNAAARGLAGITVLALVFTSTYAVPAAATQQQLASLESVAAGVREFSTLGTRMFELLGEDSLQGAAPAPARRVALSRVAGR